MKLLGGRAVLKIYIKKLLIPQKEAVVCNVGLT
jgi:hypothetical protein